MSLTRVLTQGQKDNVLPFIRPELLNTIMGIRTVLKCPNKVHQRVQCELTVILTHWVIVSRQSLVSQNHAKKVLAPEFVIHTQTTVAHVSFAYIFVNYASVLGQHQYTLLPSMSKKSAALEAKFEIAVKTLLKAPNLTVPEAMLVAKFLTKDIETKVCIKLYRDACQVAREKWFCCSLPRRSLPALLMSPHTIVLMFQT